ncbi:hypothetical protein CRM22_005521, partial [Opisthorchis felineus]
NWLDQSPIPKWLFVTTAVEMCRRLRFVFALFFLISAGVGNVAGEGEGNKCDVCVQVVKRLIEQLGSLRGDSKEVRTKFEALCRDLKKSSPEGVESRFCYLVGGHEESAAKTVMYLVEQVTTYKPAEKICMELDKKISGVCDFKYKDKIDWSKVDLNRANLKQLKKILASYDIYECPQCIEKSDYVELVKDEVRKRDPEAAKLLGISPKVEL